MLYALIRPGGAPHDNLAIAQGYAEAHRLHVVERIVDVLDHADHAGADDPCLRRGYARALHLLADSASRARGIVAVSRSSVTTASHPYEAQLLWHADHKTGLFLVRSEVEI
ncbi:hypothetical protein ACFYNX_26985 [Streptomyces sp. NPDC007872]|uniref:hypothetical protein n=1 Tax=Streptomyces sp. NPDC007872 TaxID=3364782 RepID=UPI0036850973